LWDGFFQFAFRGEEVCGQCRCDHGEGEERASGFVSGEGEGQTGSFAIYGAPIRRRPRSELQGFLWVVVG
jgi:hypothetical protein